MPEHDTLDQELAGLDHLEVVEVERAPLAARLWTATWPKLLAVALVVAFWQFAVWREWKPEFVLPSPRTVWGVFWDDLFTADLWEAVANTMRRAVLGFGLALLIGGVIGLAVTRSRLLRSAVGSLITGLQTMPSIAWFPFAILVFGLTDASIMFVVVLGAAPSIANGIIGGVDAVPPLLRRLGTSMGAGTVSLYRDFVVPAAMPSVVGGLKQGWAFSWRSLMAGELLVLIPGVPTLGGRLQFAREFSDAPSMMATMIVILIIGILVDALVFGRIERRVLSRRGLTPG
jgi:NitT/TauT family transport system permease protein